MLNAPIVMDGGAETDVSLQKKKEPYLLSAWADLAMAGGASLVLFSLCMLFVDKGAGAVSDGKILSSPILAQVSAAAFYLSFVCNFPHFILSYQLLYWDFGKRILTDRRYFGAVVLIPTLHDFRVCPIHVSPRRMALRKASLWSLPPFFRAEESLLLRYRKGSSSSESA